MMHRNRRSRRRSRLIAGFTLVELLVAMSATVLLVLFINTVFRSISEGVGTGMATSEIVQSGRVISGQIATDAAEMVGPEDNGVLVITNQWVDAPFTEHDVLLSRRADQIMFIRTAHDLESMTPGSGSNFTPNGNFNASFARVAYGHALKTEPDVFDAPLGENGPNLDAAQWVLGRQALLLSTDVEGVYARLDLGAPSDGWYEAHVAGLGSQTPSLLYYGLADIAAMGLVNEHEFYRWAMVGEGVLDPNDQDSEYRLYRGLGSTDYASRALGFGYAYERLRVSTAPSYDFEDDAYQYRPWQIAQMHPMLARGVTDFVVEFAGDYDNNPGIDLDEDGRIMWYSFEEGWEPPNTSFNQVGEGPIYINEGLPEGSAAFVFRHGPSEETNWPYLIRIRYRVTDSRAQLMDEDGVPGRMYEQIIRVPR